MRKYLLFLIILSIYTLPVAASHIVGGEFEMRHLSGNNYRLVLNLYFDLVHGLPGARDQDIQVGIYEKGSRERLAVVELPFRSETEVKYTDIECARPGILRTSKLVYYRDIVLSPNTYNNPQGYFVVWQRCCRNEVIDNITGPGETGQAFYMEFPPVTRNGQAFRNSSPVLFPPLSDYACLNELFYYDFSGTDPDGDLLVYDLVTPLRGTSDTSRTNTAPFPAVVAPFYPLVTWVPNAGYSEQNQVPGSPALTIHPTTGRLTVRPSSSGLFVFGVRAQEYRNGIKIGEVRRDFQLMVRDDCKPNTKPTIVAQQKGKAGTYREGEVLQVSSTGERCIEIKFTDPDPSTRIILSTRPINFSRDNYTLSGVTSGNINRGSTSDTLTASICFFNCFDTQGKVFEMDLIATDNGCSQPKLDTLRLRFIIEPVPNTAPVLATDKQSELQEQLLVFNLELNEAFEAKLTGSDIDLNQLMLTAAGQGFELSSYGMAFQATGGAEGNAEGVFKWVANCEAAAQGVVRVDFLLREDVCNPTPVQKLTMEFRVRVPDIEKFIPANIFTPNGDGLNDFFEMPALPAATCEGRFERISIFNRWGKEVYNSADVNFRWDGKNVIAGVYYYVIDYATSIYKGTVTIVH